MGLHHNLIGHENMQDTEITLRRNDNIRNVHFRIEILLNVLFLAVSLVQGVQVKIAHVIYHLFPKHVKCQDLLL